MSADAATMRRLATLPRRAYPWDQLRRMYIEGTDLGDGATEFPTLRVLADHVGAPPARVRAAAARGHWTQERAAYRQAREAERQRLRAATFARQMELVDDSALTACLAGIQLIADRLEQIETDPGRTDADGASDDGSFAARNPRLVHARELVALARAAIAFHTLGTRIAGAVPDQAGEVSKFESPVPGQGQGQVDLGGGSLEAVMRLLAEVRDDRTNCEGAELNDRLDQAG